MKLMKRSFTRHQFEQFIGGDFKPVNGNDGIRTNGHYRTYKDWSRKVQERYDCFCKSEKTDQFISGKNWRELKNQIDRFVTQDDDVT